MLLINLEIEVAEAEIVVVDLGKLPAEGFDLGLEPGAKLTVVEKGGILYLVPERPIEEMRGIARGTRTKGLRTKKDRH